MAISIITIDGESYDVGASAGNVAFNSSHDINVIFSLDISDYRSFSRDISCIFRKT